jgi:hypothetical protein
MVSLYGKFWVITDAWRGMQDCHIACTRDARRPRSYKDAASQLGQCPAPPGPARSVVQHTQQHTVLSWPLKWRGMLGAFQNYAGVCEVAHFVSWSRC